MVLLLARYIVLQSRIDDGFELVAGALSSDSDRALASALRLGIDQERSYSSFSVMAEKEETAQRWYSGGDYRHTKSHALPCRKSIFRARYSRHL